jgi:hypothetical protein
MPSELGEFIEAEDTMVGPRHLARHGDLAPTDQPHSGSGLVGGATRPGGDDGGAPPGEAGDAMVRVVSIASARVIAGREEIQDRHAVLTGQASRLGCFRLYADFLLHPFLPQYSAFFLPQKSRWHIAHVLRCFRSSLPS